MDDNKGIFDPRPKRRKAKDNPYTLMSIGADSDNPRYYISFNYYGDRKCVEISKELFDVFDKYELEDISYLHKVDKYMYISYIYDFETLIDMSVDTSTDETFETVTKYDELYSAIEMLTERQKRFLELYYTKGYNCREIAKMENCSFQNVAKSIQKALKKLRKEYRKE